jgi:hypothetical protein
MTSINAASALRFLYGYDPDWPWESTDHETLPHECHILPFVAVEPDATELFIEYLRSLPTRRLATSTVADAAEAVWRSISSVVTALPPPNAGPVDDNAIRMSWIAPNRYIEIDVSVYGYDWFFRDTATRESDFGGGQITEPLPENLLTRLHGML